MLPVPLFACPIVFWVVFHFQPDLMETRGLTDMTPCKVISMEQKCPVQCCFRVSSDVNASVHVVCQAAHMSPEAQHGVFHTSRRRVNQCGTGENLGLSPGNRLFGEAGNTASSS